MSTVQVSLNVTQSPPVTCNPKTTSINHGNDTINWERAANESAFTFTSLTFLNNPTCFSTPNVTASQISVTDDNEESGDYPYIIVVTLNGQQYSSSAPGIGGGSSDPMIKNK